MSADTRSRPKKGLRLGFAAISCRPWFFSRGKSAISDCLSDILQRFVTLIVPRKPQAQQFVMDWKSKETYCFEIAAIETSSDLGRLDRFRAALATKRLFKELELLNRLGYKNKNQHKSSKAFRAHLSVKRIFQKLEHLNLDSAIPAIVATKKPNSVNVLKALEKIQVKLIGAYAVFHSASDALESVYCYYRQMTCQTHFMASSLVFMSCFARLRILANYIQNQAASCFEDIVRIKATLVKGLVNLSQLPKGLVEIHYLNLLDAHSHCFKAESIVKDHVTRPDKVVIIEPTWTMPPLNQPPLLSILQKRLGKKLKKAKPSSNEIDDIFGDLF